MARTESRKAEYNYDILERFEAGMELAGHEVKSMRKHKTSLDGSHVIVRGGEAFVINLEIPPYQATNIPADAEKGRPIRLLLTKAELRKMASLEGGAGLTITPVRVYNKGSKLKMEIAVARGKKQFDKRHAIKKRETDRHIQRTLKEQ
ncbi:MAG: SsrA-binding protein SmpB [bacterium]|nr:SsrA-binding protein SmpB [bacterium]